MRKRGRRPDRASGDEPGASDDTHDTDEEAPIISSLDGAEHATRSASTARARSAEAGGYGCGRRTPIVLRVGEVKSIVTVVVAFFQQSFGPQATAV